MRQPHHRRLRFLLGISVLALLLPATGACAQSPPALSWDELLQCELVVLGRYKVHDGATLSLHVDAVLRGKSCKAGDVLGVKLAKGIQVQLPIVKGEPAPHDVAIRLARGQGVNLRQIPLVASAERAHVYFISKDGAAILDRPNQIHLDWRDGWTKALAGQPSLAFRLLYDIESDTSAKAIAELFDRRDRKTIETLLDVMLGRSAYPTRKPVGEFAERLLLNLGDSQGDVYDPVFKAMTAGFRREKDDSRLARILAHSDSKRALTDFKALLAREDARPAVNKGALLWSLPFLESAEALDLLLERIAASDYQAPFVLQELMYMQRELPLSTPRRAKIQDLAVPRIIKLINAKTLDPQTQAVMTFEDNYRYLVQELPANEVGRLTMIPHIKFWRLHDITLARQPPAKRFPDWDKLILESRGNLEPILNADLVEGRRLLEAAWKEEPRADEATLRYLAQAYGDRVLAGKVKQPLDPIVVYWNFNASKPIREPVSVLVKKLHAWPPESDNFDWSAWRLGWPILLPEHAAEYFRGLNLLLRSNNEYQREHAVKHLEERFFWNFDLDPKDPPGLMVRKLEKIKPLLAKMSRGDMLQMRGAVLEHLGIKLEGAPGKDWLPAIHAAALSWNPALNMNALHLLAAFEEDWQICQFARHPVPQRKKFLDAHLKASQERQKEKQPLPPGRVQELWKDLGNKDRAVAYAAMKTLTSDPQGTTDWLRKNLKELPVDPEPDPKRWAALIADLSSTTFTVRSQASAALKKAGPAAAPHLSQAIAKAPDLETRRRIEEIVAWHADNAGGRDRLVRAVQLLEYTTGPEARALLEELARGPEQFALTYEAKAALRRVKLAWQW